MGSMASQITSLTIVYSTVYLSVDQRKHQSSASLAFVLGIHRGPVNSPHKGPVTRKLFPFDDVIMYYQPTCLTMDSSKSQCTGAIVSVHCICTIGTILTWHTEAFIDVCKIILWCYDIGTLSTLLWYTFCTRIAHYSPTSQLVPL